MKKLLVLGMTVAILLCGCGKEDTTFVGAGRNVKYDKPKETVKHSDEDEYTRVIEQIIGEEFGGQDISFNDEWIQIDDTVISWDYIREVACNMKSNEW